MDSGLVLGSIDNGSADCLLVELINEGMLLEIPRLGGGENGGSVGDMHWTEYISFPIFNIEEIDWISFLRIINVYKTLS